MHAKFIDMMRAAALAALGLAVAGCGDLARQGNSPVQVVVRSLLGASGAQPDEFGGTLHSDVVTVVDGSSTIFPDLGQVTMSLVLKDPGSPTAPSTVSPLNQVTFTRYRVTYTRADGRNAPGVDVPYGFDSGLTFTVPQDTEVSAAFELVRHIAKEEAPLRTLADSEVLISTIADVTFYGADLAGNEVIASGQIGVVFGNFGDPE